MPKNDTPAKPVRNLKEWRAKVRRSLSEPITVYPHQADAGRLNLLEARILAGEEHLADEAKALRAEIEADALTIVFRSLTTAEWIAGVEAASKGDRAAQFMAQTHSATLGGEPVEITHEDWLDLLDNLDSTERFALTEAANALVDERVVVPDFSPTTSPTQSTESD